MKIRTRSVLLVILISGMSMFIPVFLNKYHPLGLEFGPGPFLAVLILALILAYIHNSKIIDRIDRLTLKTEVISKGNFQIDMLSIKDDEIGKLEKELIRLAYNNAGIIAQEKSEARTIQAILSGIKEGVIILDKFGKIVLVNAATEEMFDRPQDSLRGKPLMNLIHNSELDEFVSQTLQTDQEGDIEFHTREKIYSVSASILKNVTERGVMLVVRDITVIRRLETIRTEFVANVSHELRTPLTSIKGFVETLLTGAGEEKETRERFLNIIQKESLRLQRVIDDLLALSRIENKQWGMKGEPERYSFIQHAYPKIEPVIAPYAEAKGLQLVVQIPPDLPHVRMGEDLLSQVLLNLLENAVKYTAEGQVSLICSTLGNEIILEVADTGCGIPEESIPRIFERFYRVNQARSREMGGTGLGLSIVKHIVEGSGGRIVVFSQLGKGTTFQCYLPGM